MAYTGPGDIATFSNWWGLRAYSAATCGTKCVRLIRSSDSTQGDILTTAAGDLDTSSAFFDGSLTYKVVTLYDQVGTNDMTQGTDANRPIFALNAILSHFPSMKFTGSSDMWLRTGSTFTQSQPFTYFAYGQRTANFTSTQVMLIDNSGSPQAALSFNNSTNQVVAYAGAALTASATDSAYHSVINVFNGASGKIIVDSSTTTGNNGTQALSAEALIIGGDPGFGPTASMLTGNIQEAGYAASDITSSGASINSNASTYWTTISGNVGASAGSATVSGISAANSNQAGASAGVATANATSSVAAQEAGASGGVATVAATSSATAQQTGASAGTGTAAATSSATSAQAAASAGVGTASGVGASSTIAGNFGSSAGVSTVSGVSAATSAQAANSSGVGTASGVGSHTGGNPVVGWISRRHKREELEERLKRQRDNTFSRRRFNELLEEARLRAEEVKPKARKALVKAIQKIEEVSEPEALPDLEPLLEQAVMAEKAAAIIKFSAALYKAAEAAANDNEDEEIAMLLAS